MPFEGPCTTCDVKRTCGIYPDLSASLFTRPAFRNGTPRDDLDQALDRAARAWVRAVAGPGNQLDAEDTRVSLAAIFDLLCSGLYAREALGMDPESVAGHVLRCGDDLLLPYTWMCPICVSRGEDRVASYLPQARQERQRQVTRLFPLVDHISKPRSRFIGDVGIKVLKSILRIALEGMNGQLRMSEGGGRRGEFDLTLASQDRLVLCEVKAKPMIAFPLVQRGVATGAATRPRHEWQPQADGIPLGEFDLLIAATDTRIGLGAAAGCTWPLDSLTGAAADDALVRSVCHGWRLHLDAYREWVNEPDHLRWHRFGCGNFSAFVEGVRVEHRVANTKELPGLDRTDDIKKGTAQVLLFNRYKMQCQRSALRTALMGNLYAETHGVDYLDHLADMQVRDEQYPEWTWIFDMILGLTKNVFRDDVLEQAFSTATILQRHTD